jgi:hypothetical protein
MTLEAGTGYRVTIFSHRIVKTDVDICHSQTYPRERGIYFPLPLHCWVKAEG